MKKNETTVLDIAEYLNSEEIVAEYLNMVSQSDDSALFLRAIGHIARSKGMSQIAEKTGLGRESLYKALDEKAHPRFETIFKVLNAMGIQMTLVHKVKFRKRNKQTDLCVADKRARHKASLPHLCYLLRILAPIGSQDMLI
jgi:probable addiction module antidote protein